MNIDGDFVDEVRRLSAEKQDGVPQKVQPTSVEGDIVHTACTVVLDWMEENGEPQLVEKARTIRENWVSEQGWIIAWGTNSHFFDLVRVAVADPKNFYRMKEIVGSEGEGVDRIVGLVEKALERIKEKREEDRGNSQPIKLSRYKKQSKRVGVKK